MEAELTALDTASVEAKWLREFLMDLPVVEKPVPAISMNCDNQTVIIKINSSKDNMKSTRHIKRRLKSMRKLRNSRVIALDYVHTSKNLADQFTKRLSRSVIDSASSRDENETDTAGYRIIPYPILMYFSRIRDRIRVVKIRDGYRTGPGNNLGG
jgi:hypothetical protein